MFKKGKVHSKTSLIRDYISKSGKILIAVSQTSNNIEYYAAK